jgi:hypothetical protein
MLHLALGTRLFASVSSLVRQYAVMIFSPSGPSQSLTGTMKFSWNVEPRFLLASTSFLRWDEASSRRRLSTFRSRDERSQRSKEESEPRPGSITGLIKRVVTRGFSRKATLSPDISLRYFYLQSILGASQFVVSSDHRTSTRPLSVVNTLISHSGCPLDRLLGPSSKINMVISE